MAIKLALDAGWLLKFPKFGAIAQLGERLNGIQEVGGSTPPGSTNRMHGNRMTNNRMTGEIRSEHCRWVQ